MTIDNYQISLKLFLQNKNGETLILESPDHFENKGFYDAPGGRIDIDEFEVDCRTILQREVVEELGSNIEYNVSLNPVSMGRFLCRGDKICMIFFEAQYISGDIKLSDEHKSLMWVKLEKLNLEKYFRAGMLEGVKNYLKYR